MAKIVVVHKNTETKEIDLGKNDKVAWIVLMDNNGKLTKFFAETEQRGKANE